MKGEAGLRGKRLGHAAITGLVASNTRRYRRPMFDWSQCSEVERVPGKVSGAWLFKGTRVPVRALFENLRGRRERG